MYTLFFGIKADITITNLVVTIIYPNQAKQYWMKWPILLLTKSKLWPWMQ